jgi:hypothetical protein
MGRMSQIVEEYRERRRRAAASHLRLRLSGTELMHRASMRPAPFQRRLLTKDRGDAIVCCSRQAGKSQSGSVLATHFAWRYPGFLVSLVAPTLRQAVELGRKCRALLPYLPDTRAVRDAETLVELHNGSRIMCFPGKPDSVRGPSPKLIIVDEAAFCPDELFEALTPSRSRTGADLILLSTPNGRTGRFYEVWQSKDPGLLKIRVPWTEIPELTPEVVEPERALMPAARFAAEYECAFTSPVGAVFDASVIAAARDERPTSEVASVIAALQ